MSIATQSVSSPAADIPGATAVFRRNGIHFCSGGGRSLAAAAQAEGLNLANTEAELLQTDKTGEVVAAAELSTPALITLIVDRFHAGHRADLPELLRLAERVVTVHGDHPVCPRGLTVLLRTVWLELEPHLEKEEEILFPMMLVGGSPVIHGPISCMVQEHDDFADQLQALEDLTSGFADPPEACATWRALNATLARFVAEAREHVHLENDVLFPRFARVAGHAAS